MKKLAAPILIAIALLTGALAAPVDAAYKCASWGCAERVSLTKSTGRGTYRIDDRYVRRTWPTPQSSVDACTYLYVHSKATYKWWYIGSDCGGNPDTVTFSIGEAIDAVQIRSKDSRGRWRYMTIDGKSIAP